MMVMAIQPLTSPDHRAFLDSLFRTCYRPLLKIAGGIIGSTQAEDVVIETFISMFGKVGLLQELNESECAAYLRTAVRHAAYKVYNAQKHKNLTEAVPIDSALFSLPAPEEEAPDHIATKNEEYRQVRDAIAALPRQDREVLYLKYMARMTAREIAEMTNAPNEAAVQMRLSRARRKVLRRLEDRGWRRE